MSDKPMTPQEKAALGAQAKAVLENPAFKRAIEMVETSMFKAWKESAPGESEGRERLYAHVHVLRSLTAALNQILGDGQISAATIQQAKGRKGI